MRREGLVIAGLIILLGLSLAGRFVFPEKFVLANYLEEAIKKLNPQAPLENKIAALKEENASLKTALLNQKISSAGLVKVYSSYPFNNQKTIALAAGADQGVRAGQVVTINQNILVGKITSVSANESIAQTIFDPNFRLAVRIGSSQTNGLFEGGNELVVNLIPASAKINEGDVVLSAGAGLPYGLSLGEVASIISSKGEPYESVIITPAFSLEDLTDVTLSIP